MFAFKEQMIMTLDVSCKKTTSVSLLSLSTDPGFNHLQCGITGQGVMSLSLKMM